MQNKIVAFVFVFVLGVWWTLFSGCKNEPTQVALDVATKPFQALSKYHFFKGKLSDLLPNERVLHYDLISGLFTDYAHKARFLYVPEGKQVAYDDKEVFDLPVGSCYIKNFYYPNDFRDLSKGRRIIETRLLVKRENGWEALDYIWDDDQKDAKLDVAGDVKKVSWIHDDGKKMEINYVIPNKNQCKGCHWINGKGIMPIGPKARNLNKDLNYGTETKNQLAMWASSNILSGSPAPNDCPKVADYMDEKESLDARARAYLDINCAHCHRSEGPAYTSGLLVNFYQDNKEHLGVCKTPVAAGKGTGDRLYDIVPGHPEKSIIVYRMESEDAAIKMPEVGRVLAHKEGVELISKWIASLEGECK
jgi:uncharacterized repeat protein (TIGR03806 family)